jgi:ABC-type nitrate/sulfonate/bicarbonate transport system ATPase subunit
MNLVIECAYVKYHRSARAIVDMRSATEIPCGVHALVGESGAGKSTLMRLVAGWFACDRRTCSAPTIIYPSAAEVLYLSKDSILLPWFSVKHSIEIVAASFGRTVDWDSIRAWLAVAELGHGVLKMTPDKLSSGMAARLDLACAFAANPSVLLIDEVIGLVPAKLRTKILNFLLTRRDCVTLIATHNQDIAQQAESIYTISAEESSVRRLDVMMREAA